MTTTKLHWDEVGRDEAERRGGRTLWVSDGTHGYAATLPDGVTVEEALADFGRRYDDPDAAVQDYRLYE